MHGASRPGNMPPTLGQALRATRPVPDSRRPEGRLRHGGRTKAKAALASVGASFENVVKLNNYIIDIGTNIAHYREVRDKYVNTAAPPASTTIGVPQLARPGALFEVEAIAVLPPK